MAGLHIAVLNPGAETGGAEISLLELIRHLGTDLRMTVILPEDGPLRSRAEAAGAATHVISWPRRLMAIGERAGRPGVATALAAATAVPRLCHQLRSFIREIGADCIITNGIKCHILGAVACKANTTPLVWYMRDGLEGRRFSSALMRLLASRCSGAIAISRYVENESRRVIPGDVPVHFLYDIIDSHTYRPGLPPPADLHKADGEIRFGIVGAITPLKGQDLFLEACRTVARALPRARFLLVGDNFYRTETRLGFATGLRERADAADLHGRVLFLGQRNDVPAVLSTIDVLVQPNRGPEGLGRSVLEAMACGVPAIAVDRWGPAELIRDGDTGVLTPWMDVPALAERMIALGRDPALRARLGANARTWVLRHLAPEHLAARFTDIIELLTRPRADVQSHRTTPSAHYASTTRSQPRHRTAPSANRHTGTPHPPRTRRLTSHS